MVFSLGILIVNPSDIPEAYRLRSDAVVFGRETAGVWRQRSHGKDLLILLS